MARRPRRLAPPAASALRPPLRPVLGLEERWRSVGLEERGKERQPSQPQALHHARKQAHAHATCRKRCGRLESRPSGSFALQCHRRSLSARPAKGGGKGKRSRQEIKARDQGKRRVGSCTEHLHLLSACKPQLVQRTCASRNLYKHKECPCVRTCYMLLATCNMLHANWYTRAPPSNLYKS